MKQVWRQRYQILEQLGRGGSGQVYKVWDLHLEKVWAMKELAGDSDREAKVLKQLSHHRFPRVVDAFREGETNYLVMDYVPGITLETLIQKGPIEEKSLIALAKQIIQALRYLHEGNPTLLYLDLKPSNLLLDENGQLKLVDLGSVQVKGKEGGISGTPGFASPEQIRVRRQGRELNEQSDIFSFGMLLFAMGTGRLTGLPIIDEGRRQGIYIRSYNPLLSPGLEKIIEGCTRGKAERRYLSMRDIHEQLEILERKLGRGKKRGIFPARKRIFAERSEWRQEKSILCTQGKSSVYISGKPFFSFMWWTLPWLLLMMTICTLPASKSMAEEKNLYPIKLQDAPKEDILPVIIRDLRGRKVLVKEGNAYQTGDSLFFEIQWEELGTTSCSVTIICREEGGRERCFSLQCIKK